jgi:superfamily II RNA helicase
MDPDQGDNNKGIKRPCEIKEEGQSKRPKNSGASISPTDNPSIANPNVDATSLGPSFFYDDDPSLSNPQPANNNNDIQQPRSDQLRHDDPTTTTSPRAVRFDPLLLHHQQSSANRSSDSLSSRSSDLSDDVRESKSVEIQARTIKSAKRVMRRHVELTDSEDEKKKSHHTTVLIPDEIVFDLPRFKQKPRHPHGSIATSAAVEEDESDFVESGDEVEPMEAGSKDVDGEGGDEVEPMEAGSKDVDGEGGDEKMGE